MIGDVDDPEPVERRSDILSAGGSRHPTMPADLLPSGFTHETSEAFLSDPMLPSSKLGADPWGIAGAPASQVDSRDLLGNSGVCVASL